MTDVSRPPPPDRHDRADRVVAVDLVRCALPLERPVHVGWTTYREREYVAVRLSRADADRGPRDRLHARAAARRDGPAARGEASWARAWATAGAVVDALVAANVNAHRLALARGLAARDRARPTRRARREGRPLWRLLGGARARVPLMAVAGYTPRERGATPSSTRSAGCWTRGSGS